MRGRYWVQGRNGPKVFACRLFIPYGVTLTLEKSIESEGPGVGVGRSLY